MLRGEGFDLDYSSSKVECPARAQHALRLHTLPCVRGIVLSEARGSGSDRKRAGRVAARNIHTSFHDITVKRGHNFCSVKFVYYVDGTMPKAYAAFWERASITPRLTDRKFPLKAH